MDDRRTRAAALYTVAAGLVLIFVLAATTLRFSELRNESILKHGLAEFALVQRDSLLQLVSEEGAADAYEASHDPQLLNVYALAAREFAVDRDVVQAYAPEKPDLLANLSQFDSAAKVLELAVSRELAFARTENRAAALMQAKDAQNALEQVRRTDRHIEEELASDRTALFGMSLKVSDVAIRTSLLLELVVLAAMFTFLDVLRSARTAHASANEDALTGIANRRMALRSLQRLLHRGRVETIALLYLDLDGFKKINDQHGHASGDAILIEAAKRLKNSVRDGDIVARLGGDEFLCILPGPVDREIAKRIADRVHDRLTRAYAVGKEKFTLGCSVGWIVEPARGNKADELLSMADRAMYDAKASGGGVQFFPPTIQPAPARA